MLSSIALLFFALATSVAVPMPGVPETELRPLADVEEARCLAWRGGEWGRLPTPSDLPGLIDPVPDIRLQFTITHTPLLYVTPIPRLNNPLYAPMALNVAALEHRSGGEIVGYWGRTSIMSSDMIKIIFQDNAFKWSSLTGEERQYVMLRDGPGGE